MRRFLAALLLLACLSAPAMGQERETPYWATLRASEVNMRVGPSSDYPVSWVYRRQGLPVKVIRLNQGWRLVQDPDGAEGWIVARLLSPERGAIVIGEGMAEIHKDAAAGSPVLWRAEPGVVGRLGECEQGWCRLDMDGRKGWVREDRIWGGGEP
ncbi:conserved hypothetical protein [Altererythrobacter sp. B11]|uniref:SH3 domain-containing protein n=1 Tax=Altererythrobacter sp. B11 TaxID=2060312 RepID=UPI000DC6E190|nr:SH3 domain-containing protein [Altererythrobacter sp. B11]BBC72996.1 conserved hypothetical protein [Altererythrobacter sp. B11]